MLLCLWHTADQAMREPRVSYVVASYNHERYVGDLLRSILNQTFVDLELVVVDDGSTDRTLQIAREIAATDSRMRVYAQQNRGVVEARNRGVLCSRGDYVSIVDSDDLLPLERTAWQVTELDANAQASLVYGDAWIIDQSDRRLRRRFEIYPPVPGDFSCELFANYCFVPAVSVMFRRSAFDRSGPFWGPGPHTDYLKWIELGELGRAACLSDRQLGYWRLHGENASRPSGENRVRQYESLCNALQSLVQRLPDLAQRIGEKRVLRRYARCHFMGAFYAGLGRSWSSARIQFAKAFAYSPSLLHAAAWASTLPVVNVISAPLYPLAARMRKLP
jgi:glycosyltransferase involved in cell wall biosynthesis